MNTHSFEDRFDFTGKKIAVLACDGFEESELLVPVEALQTCNATVHVLTPGGEAIRGWNGSDWGQTISADGVLAEANPEEYDALLLPGGVKNSDTLRTDADAQDFCRHFFDSSKPVFCICHGAQVLIDADLVVGRTMTSYESIAQDLRNAGADWVNEEVVVDKGFVTSRSPADLPAFCVKMCEELLEGVHA